MAVVKSEIGSVAAQDSVMQTQISAQIAAESGNSYFTTIIGRQEVTFSPIPIGGALEVTTSIVVDPPVGEFVFYPWKMEYVYKVDGVKGVDTYIGYMHFTDFAGNPFERLGLKTGVSLLSTESAILYSDITVDTSGVVSFELSNPSVVAAGWAKAVLTVGGPFITIP